MNIKPIAPINLYTKFIKLKPQQYVIPAVTTPLVAYYVGQNQDRAADEILNFFHRKNIKVPEFLRPHADTKTGFNAESKTKIKKALEDALDKGKITDKEYATYTNKVTFTGHDDCDDLAQVGDYATDTDVSADDSIIDAILDFIDELF